MRIGERWQSWYGCRRVTKEQRMRGAKKTQGRGFEATMADPSPKPQVRWVIQQTERVQKGQSFGKTVKSFSASERVTSKEKLHTLESRGIQEARARNNSSAVMQKSMVSTTKRAIRTGQELKEDRETGNNDE